MLTKRIGIYAGTFDPVHAGHMAFALQALEAATLDEIYFMPERRPRHRANVEHFAHRVAMLKQATLPYKHFGVIESVDVSFSVKRTLPMLKQKFKGAQLVFLFGSDAVGGLPDWPYAAQLLQNSELVIAAQAGKDTTELQAAMASWPVQPQAAVMLTSFAPAVSSSIIREALRARQPVPGLLQSVARYSNRHWLYVSFR